MMQLEIFEAVRKERKNQDEIWGDQNHEPLYWMGILTEEVGEYAKSIICGDMEGMQEELIQIAAVAIAALESHYRNEDDDAVRCGTGRGRFESVDQRRGGSSK